MGKGVLAAMTVLAITVLALTLVACAGTSQALRDARAAARIRAAQARTIAGQAGLGPDVQSFLARAAGASAERYTVVYNQGAGQTTTVISDPPNRRIDVQGATGAGSLDRVVVKGTKNYVCHRAPSSNGQGKWTCTQGGTAAPSGPFTPDAIADTIGSLVQLSGTYTFAVAPRRILGLNASCLSADRKPDQPARVEVGDHGAICVAPNGVILVVEGVGTALVAKSYRTSVPSAAFDLPATASPAPTT